MLSTKTRVLTGLMLVGALAAATAAAASVSTTPVLIVPELTPVGEGAASTIVRDQTGVSITIYTKNLDPGAYTVWLLVWNNPENCVIPNDCSPTPLGPDVPDSVVYGTNGVVGANGNGYFGTRLNLADTSRVRGGALQEGLLDAMGAEVHAVMVSHGAVNGDLVDAQFFTPNGACDGACPAVQGAPHRPGPDELSNRLDALKQLIDRIARRNGLRP